MKIIPLFLFCALLITSCLPGDKQLPQSPLLPFLERKSGLIAYIGADGNIYTSDQAGGKKIAHTDDAVIPTETSDPFRLYAFPAWSRDGASLGFVGISGQGNSSSSEVFIANLDEDTTKKVFSSDSEQPVYLYWSPDNTDLSFISSPAGRASMVLQSVSSDSDKPTIIDTGSPFYWSWAPDGRTMIVHSGSEQSTVPEHLAFLEFLDGDSDIIEQDLETVPASFQSPAWSPDGSHILMARLNDEEKKEIIVTDGQGKFEQAIDTYDVNTAFAWSNNSDRIAYIVGDRALTAGVLGTLHVIDRESSEELFNAENVYGFFWSPNDKRIAYFTPAVTDGASGEQQLLLNLHVADVDTGESRELFTFRPTEQFASIMPYFDQYHQSATIWSPDSSYLVFSFLTENNQAGIGIIAASGQLEPRLLDGGYLAFWSWE